MGENQVRARVRLESMLEHGLEHGPDNGLEYMTEYRVEYVHGAKKVNLNPTLYANLFIFYK